MLQNRISGVCLCGGIAQQMMSTMDISQNNILNFKFAL